MPTLDLSQLINDFAAAIKRVDARRPQAVNQRTGHPFQPGFGPHPESQAVALVAQELEQLSPEHYAGRVATAVTYPGASRQRCDLCIGTASEPGWALEVKMLRFHGDNGKVNDNILMHILSPYPAHRSALTDCTKLVESAFSDRKAVLIYGFESRSYPLEPAIDAFETLARQSVNLGARCTGTFKDLIHPVHAAGRVFGWEVSSAELSS